MDRFREILNNLGIQQSAQRVYVSLVKDGEATANVLAKRTGITRPSVYDQIKELRKKDLVVERAVGGKTFFAASDVRRIDAMLGDRIERLSSDRELLADTLASFMKQAKTVQPKIKFFEGKEGAQQLMKDILWHDDITLSIFWPYQQMREILGDDFLQWFNERRVKRHIAVKTIWPNKERKSKDHIFVENDTYVTRKYAQPNQVCDMGYMVYDNKVAFISSTKEAFGFIVESKEFAALTTMQFESLWKEAKVEK